LIVREGKFEGGRKEKIRKEEGRKDKKGRRQMKGEGRGGFWQMKPFPLFPRPKGANQLVHGVPKIQLS
jgi:hypothetical protein